MAILLVVVSACPTKFDRPRPTAMRDRGTSVRPARGGLPAVAEPRASQHITLRDGDLWVAHQNGTRVVEVRCVAGCVWITQEGHSEDIVLSAGGRSDVP